MNSKYGKSLTLRKRSHLSLMGLRQWTCKPRGSREMVLEVQLPLKTPQRVRGQAGGRRLVPSTWSVQS